MNHAKLASIVRARASLAFVLWVVSSQAANSQPATAPEAVPAGVPVVQSPPPPPPVAKYDSLDAGRDAYLRAEAQRREAIARQLAGNAYAPSHIFPLGMRVLKARPRVCLPAAGRPLGLSGLCAADHHGPALGCFVLCYANRRMAGSAGGAVSLRQSC